VSHGDCLLPRPRIKRHGTVVDRLADGHVQRAKRQLDPQGRNLTRRGQVGKVAHQHNERIREKKKRGGLAERNRIRIRFCTRVGRAIRGG